jgi:imidazolonepropionase-like amidohydrolase
VEVIENGTIVVDHDGNIAAVGTEEELSKAEPFRTATYDVDIDATGKVVMPGTCELPLLPFTGWDVLG